MTPNALRHACRSAVCGGAPIRTQRHALTHNMLELDRVRRHPREKGLAHVLLDLRVHRPLVRGSPRGAAPDMRHGEGHEKLHVVSVRPSPLAEDQGPRGPRSNHDVQTCRRRVLLAVRHPGDVLRVRDARQDAGTSTT